MTIPKRLQLLLAIALTGAAPFAARAAYVPNVTIHNVSFEFTAATDSRRATNLVNDIGMYGDVVTSVPNGSAWLTKTAPSQVGTNFVTFDLGAVRPVKSMVVWNYNETAGLRRGVSVADISTSSDGIAFTTNFPSASFNAASGLFTNTFAQTFDFGNLTARFVRLNIRSNQFTIGADVAVGLNKVRFIDTNVPPRLTLASMNFSSNKVTAYFSETVTAVTATNLANYALQTDGTNSAIILSAAFDVYNNRVALQTSPLTNSSYSLVASGVRAASDDTAITNNSTLTVERELAVWLKADAGVVADGGGLVSQWSDQSGNGNHALQSDPALQPTLVTSAMNGQPVLHFNANATVVNYLQIPPASSHLLRHDYSVVAVVRTTDLSNPPRWYGVINKVNAANGQPVPFDMHIERINASSGGLRFYRGQGYINTAMNGLTNVAPGQSMIFTCTQRGTVGNQYLNGAFNQRVVSLLGSDDWGRPMTVGSREGLGVKMNGDIAEIMVLRGALSDSERNSIHDYLSAKYGIPVVNLDITQQPVDATSVEGLTATFSVTAIANQPTINYQWQRYGTNLPSATNATYTTPALTMADNNATFRVVLSVPNATLQSSTVTLTVLEDLENPTVTAAGRKIWAPSQIVVAYSESVTPITATNIGNYALDNGAAVTSAAMGDAPNKVVLATTMTNGGAYLLSVQNVQDLYDNVIVPTQVLLGVYPHSMALWLKADVGVTADSLGAVSQWDDQSGNVNTAFQSTPQNMPLLITNAFNGLPALNFLSASNSYLYAFSSPTLAILGDLSIITVARFQTLNNYNSLVAKASFANPSQPASYDFYTVNGNNGRGRLYRGTGISANSTFTTATQPVAVNAAQVVSVTMSGANAIHFLDGVTNGVGFTTHHNFADNGDPVYIGGRADGLTRMNGDIAEVMVFGSALPEAELMALHEHLGTKYGVMIGGLPTLKIASGPGPNVIFSWPTPFAPMTLESTTNLAASVWSPITNSISSANGTNTVTLPANQGAQYFRLHKQ